MLRIGDGGRGVDHLVHAFGGRPGQLGHDHHRGHGACRGGHGGDVGGEREEGAEADAAAHGQHAAEGDHADQAGLRYGRQGRGETGVDGGGTHAFGEQLASVPFQPVDHSRFLAEPLDHPDAGDRFLDVLGEVGRTLLRRPGGRVQLGPDPVHHHGDGGHYQQRDRGQQRRQPHHHRRGEQELQQRHPRQRRHRQQALHQLQVGDRPRHHLPGPDRVLPGAVESLQRAEQIHPQRMLDIQRQSSGQQPPPEGGEEPAEGEQHQERGNGSDHPGIADARRIDGSLGQQWRDDLGGRPRQHRDRDPDNGPPMPCALPPQPPNPAWCPHHAF